MSPSCAVFLYCKQAGFHAKLSLTVIDEAATGTQDIDHCLKQPRLFDGSTGWGWPKVATHERLHSRPGYLAGDRLVLRACVEVVP